MKTSYSWSIFKFWNIYFYFILSLFNFVVYSNSFALTPAIEPTSIFDKKCYEIMKNPHHKTESTRLHELFQISWDVDLLDSPEGSTYIGEKGRDHLWTDMSDRKLREYEHKTKSKLKVLLNIKYAQLNAADQLNYDLFKNQLENEIQAYPFKGEYLQIDQMGGPQQNISLILTMMPTDTPADFENRIQRISSIPTYLEQITLLLKKGLKAKITPPKVTLRDVPDQIQKHTDKNFDINPLFQSFRNMPSSFSKEDQEAILAKAKKAILEKAIPAFEQFHTFIVQEYLPGCRDSIAWSDLPQGEQWYKTLAKKMTTTSLTPKEIHEIGLYEVARIQKEIDGILKATHFKGKPKDYNSKLYKSNDQFYSKKEDLIDGYKKLSENINPKLPLLFLKTPKLTFEIQPLPEHSEKSTAAGYYLAGSMLTQRAGVFYANTYNLKARPKWQMAALFLHEAVPGHHFQIATAQELDSLPRFRKHMNHTAYTEGWGLYAEKLGYDIGAYTEVESRFGQLSAEIWRAVRLVVDTGIHTMGWSREKAIQYFKDNSMLDEHEIEVEVDRYVVMPAQALAYKIGQLKFSELRELAKTQLGGAFNVRKYHEVALNAGSIPLSILEKRVKNWIDLMKNEDVKESGRPQ